MDNINVNKINNNNYANINLLSFYNVLTLKYIKNNN